MGVELMKRRFLIFLGRGFPQAGMRSYGVFPELRRSAFARGEAAKRFI